MSNLIAIGVHCRRGDEVICGNQAHLFLYEGGGANGDTSLTHDAAVLHVYCC